MKLSNEQLIRIAPSVATTTAFEGTSAKYNHISTLEIVNSLRSEGWTPTTANEVNTRKESMKGFQKHIVRMSHNDLVMNDDQVEMIITNSHDGKSSYQFMTGIFRFICANGLVVGDTFEKIRVKHMGFTMEDAIEASYSIVDKAPELVEHIKEMKGTTLSLPEQTIMAEASIDFLYGEDSPIEPQQLLRARRYEDNDGSTIWNSYNKIQENIIKGGLRGRNAKTMKRTTTRKIKSIDKTTKVNKVLWDISMKMAELKNS